MKFSDRDWRPNPTIPLANVRVGAVSDARWRGVPAKTRTIDSLARLRLQQGARGRHQQHHLQEENRGRDSSS